MTISVGAVKWFGGINRKTNKENNFGFLTDVEDFDVYLNLSDWSDDVAPRENAVVVYTREEKAGKWKAKSACLLSSSNPTLTQLIGWLTLSESEGGCNASPYGITKKLSETIRENSHRYSVGELEKCVTNQGVSKLVETLSVARNDWGSCFNNLVDNDLIDPLVDLSWNGLPEKHSIIKNEKEVAERLLSMELDKARDLVKSNYRMLTAPLKVLVSFAGLIQDRKQLKSVVDDVTPLIRSVYLKESSLPEYVKEYIDTNVKPKGGVINDPVLGPLFSLCQFKKYLYDKDPKFVALYDSSDYLQSRFDAFVLKELFSLVFAGNPLDQVYNLFLNGLWGGITSGQLNPVSQRKQILELFPSCNSVSGGFSCEAVYWKKTEAFLCRGRPCLSPKVIGQAGPDYLAFSIYDWFVHYGINYLEGGKPSNRDFPIKIAGYLNRVREIFDVIHCRDCESLMLPNMSYARVDYMAIENGQLVKRDMAPAYRLTVFECPDNQCIEFKNGYYISHCYGCNALVDSRDSTAKCDASRYICRSCASCCGGHSKSNPVGLCPDCISPLQLFETQKKQRFGNKNERYVTCSNQCCSFNIPTKNLNKRFYFDSCGPVYTSKN